MIGEIYGTFMVLYPTISKATAEMQSKKFPIKSQNFWYQHVTQNSIEALLFTLPIGCSESSKARTKLHKILIFE